MSWSEFALKFLVCAVAYDLICGLLGLALRGVAVLIDRYW